MTDFPVLRVRASDPLRFTEISLGGVDLMPLFVTSIQIQMSADNVTRASLIFEVIPDIELPVELDAWLHKQHDDGHTTLTRAEPSTTEAD